MRVRRVTIQPGAIPLLRDFPALDRRIWGLALARFVVNAGFSAVMPFLAMHLVVERGVSLLQVGALWTSVGLVGSASTWLGGRLTTRIGQRRILLGAMMLRSVNLAALGVAILGDAPFWALGILCAVNGAMRAFYDPAATAAVASMCSNQERVAAFSLHRVGGSLGWTAGPILGAAAGHFSFGGLFLIAAPITLAGALLVAAVPTDPAPASTGNKRRPVLSVFTDLVALARLPVFGRFLLATVLFFMLQTQLYHILAIYAGQHLGLSRFQVGSLFVVNGVLVVLLQLPAVKFISHIGTAQSLVLGSVGFVIAYIGCAFASSYLTLLPCVALATLSEIIASPAHQARVAALAPPGHVAEYAGATGMAQGIAQTLGPLLGSALLASNPRPAWAILAIFGVVAAMAFGRQPLPAPMTSAAPRPAKA